MEGWARWDLPILLLYEASKTKGNETIRGDYVIVASFRLSLRHRWWRGVTFGAGSCMRGLLRWTLIPSPYLPTYVCVRARARAYIYTELKVEN